MGLPSLGIARPQINLNVTPRNPDGGRVTDRAEFLFEEVARWDVAPGVNGAEQMALDEAMLRLADRPTLRVYRWSGPAVTFGYPQRFADAEKFATGRPVTRRSTGGGFVEHGKDLTIALAVPAARPFARLAPAETYRRIHATVAAMLADARLATCEDCSGGAACFVSPALHDVMIGGRKVLGGAQRRSREGFLYQGSLQGARLADDLASRLAPRVVEWRPVGWRNLRDALIRERYGLADWNRRR